MSESFKYNEVTLSPLKDVREARPETVESFQPDLGQLFAHIKNGVETPVILVTEEQLSAWLKAINDGKDFRKAVSTDIGYVVREIDKLINEVQKSPMTFVSNLGKALISKSEVKLSIGIDFDKIKAIGQKYAPDTMATIAPPKETEPTE